MLAECRQAPFEPIIVLLEVLILNEVLALFVDAVIGELAENVGFGILCGVLLGCEPNKALLVNIDP